MILYLTSNILLLLPKAIGFIKKMIHYNTWVSLHVRDVVGCEFPVSPFNPPFFRFIYFKIHSFTVKSYFRNLVKKLTHVK